MSNIIDFTTRLKELEAKLEKLGEGTLEYLETVTEYNRLAGIKRDEARKKQNDSIISTHRLRKKK